MDWSAECVFTENIDTTPSAHMCGRSNYYCLVLRYIRYEASSQLCGRDYCIIEGVMNTPSLSYRIQIRHSNILKIKQYDTSDKVNAM